MVLLPKQNCKIEAKEKYKTLRYWSFSRRATGEIIVCGAKISFKVCGWCIAALSS
jgi:hypothetical protein